MKIMPIDHKSSKSHRRERAQGLVEFALILPMMLLMIFVIIELARVLHAWLAVENGARFGVRYAVTGEFDDAQCWIVYPLTGCETQSQEDGARIPSIKAAARAGAVAILRNDSVTTVGDPGYFKVTVCSSKPGVAYLPSDSDTPTAAECVPVEDGGGPGDRVIVTIDFDHPLITPMISSVWPDLHLSAKREGIVEQFRTARVVGLPATAAGPSPTPTNTPTPSNTPTNTSTPTLTNTP
ncbi:MAG: TadE/TadG family type IV pilus assembly protein, partial [Anaerolineales bacterium]